MSSISEINNMIESAKVTPADKVQWDGELKQILQSITNEQKERGVIKVSNTDLLSTVSTYETSFVLVSSVGIFYKKQTEDSPDGDKTFPSADFGYLWEKVFHSEGPKMILSIKNYEGDTDLSFPLGVFSVSGQYLGIAENADTYKSIWNSDTGNSQLGKISSHIGDLQFEVTPTYINSVINLYGLEYYTITAPSSVEIHLSDGDMVAYGSTFIKAENGVLTDSNTRREYNATVSDAVGSKFTTEQFWFRKVSCSGYIANSPLRIFHNRTSKYFGVSLSYGLNSIEGIMPSSLEVFFSPGSITCDYRLIQNWNSLNSLKWFRLAHHGNSPWQITDSDKVPQPVSTNLLGISLGNLWPPISSLNSSFSWFNSENFPSLKQAVFYVVNLSSTNILGNSKTFFDTIPTTIDTYLYIGGGTAASSVDCDYVINKVYERIGSNIPQGIKTIRLVNASARTSASNTAYNALIAAGWTVLLT